MLGVATVEDVRNTDTALGELDLTAKVVEEVGREVAHLRQYRCS